MEQLDGALKNITNREAANHRILEFDSEFADLTTSHSFGFLLALGGRFSTLAI